jgi:hypothetical protein
MILRTEMALGVVYVERSIVIAESLDEVDFRESYDSGFHCLFTAGNAGGVGFSARLRSSI